MLNLVLFQPEIPSNTGNLIRLSANMGANLHLIKPYGFEMNDKRLRRAGLDYKDLASVYEYDNFDDYSNDGNNSGYTEKGFPKGCTLTYRKKNELKCSYLYPELELSNEEYESWIEENRRKITNS